MDRTDHVTRRHKWQGPVFVRASEIRTAYDCSVDRSLCTHNPKARHGFWFDEWWYAVATEQYILSFGICPCTYPKGMEVETHFKIITPHMIPLSLKLWSVTQDSSVWLRPAISFAEENAVFSYEQPEEFWRAMEDLFTEETRKLQS